MTITSKSSKNMGESFKYYSLSRGEHNTFEPSSPSESLSVIPDLTSQTIQISCQFQEYNQISMYSASCLEGESMTLLCPTNYCDGKVANNYTWTHDPIDYMFSDHNVSYACPNNQAIHIRPDFGSGTLQISCQFESYHEVTGPSSCLVGETMILDCLNGICSGQIYVE